MKILFTGASSFTGYWFVSELAARGHEVVVPLRGARCSYDGVRAARVEKLKNIADIVWTCPFGQADFQALIERQSFDLLCHHAARVGNYRSPDFDALGAAAENTLGLPFLLRAMRERGSKGIILTGSVFEPDEGSGSLPLRAFSPYGLSKGITAQIVRYWCSALDVPMGKFVIPNSFGPFEEPRFCAYLMKCWRARETAAVRAPQYVRDNIHVTLLARCYVRFAETFAEGGRDASLNPSGYAESQGQFAERLAREFRARLSLECRIDLAAQTDFSEPLVRVNTTPGASLVPDWNESDTWDSYADYYR